MKTKLLNTAIMIAIMLGTQMLPAQMVNFEWAISIGSEGVDRGNAITTDASGNVYAAGRFSGTADFDNSSNTYNLTSNGEGDIFVAKYNSSGDLIWAKSIGGDSLDGANGITIDNNGNVIVSGIFNKNVDFDPGTGTHYLSSNNQSSFVLKLDSNGNFIWAVAFNSTDWCSVAAGALVADGNNNILVAGSFQGTMDSDPGTNTKNLVSNGWDDGFVVKLNASGEYVWACLFGDYNAGDRISSVDVDNTGNVYLTGTFRNTVDFDPSGNTYNLTSNGKLDVFFVKLNASGEFVFAKSIGGSESEYIANIVVDNSGNIFIAGSFNDKVDFDPGSGTFYLTASSQDAFIAKYDPSGNFIWAKSFGGYQYDIIRSICLDASGNIYCAGGFMGKADLDPGTGTHYLSSVGEWDAFVSKLDPSGNLIWVKQMGGTGFDFSPSLCLDASGNIYSTGWFSTTTNFDVNYSNVSIASKGGEDVYIHKINQSTCNTNLINVSLSLNYFGAENSWEIINSSNQVVASGGPYKNSTFENNISQNICLPNGCYTFIIYDSGNDGMGGFMGNSRSGSYTVTNIDNSTVIAKGSKFKSSQSHGFCLTETCNITSNMISSGITDSEATVSWNSINNAASYNVRIRTQNGSWNNVNTTNTSYAFSGLSTCTVYEYEIETVCSGGTSGYSSGSAFKTTGCTSNCDAPSGLFVSNINKKNARLNWDAVSGATSYEASYWLQGSSSVKTVTTTATQVNINGLNVNSTYEWRVRAKCTNDWSDYSTTHSFEAGVTTSGAYVQEEEQTLSSGKIESNLIHFNISPNPTTGHITVLFESSNQPATHIQIMDMHGRIIMKIENDMGNTFSKEIDMSHLANGIYLIHVLNNSTLLKSAKVIKAE